MKTQPLSCSSVPAKQDAPTSIPVEVQPLPLRYGKAENHAGTQAVRGVRPVPRSLVAVLNLAATVQVVWFYVNRIRPHIQLLAYEQGRERTPFQYRLLMMYPMRWAHQSAAMLRLAHRLSALPGFFPNGVRPEGVVQSAIDMACVVTAGVVARRLYQRSSLTGLLTPYIYPLALIMVATTYCLLDMHLLRFIYDLPSLALFALGLEAIYFRRNPFWIAAVFMVATINRETSLLLLIYYAAAECFRHGEFKWRRLRSPSSFGLISSLGILWLAWHAYVVHRFAFNTSESVSRMRLNVGILLLPLTWPQMLGAFASLWLLVWLRRRRIHDPVLRAWVWMTPVWTAFMFYYGIFIETRIFGEMIPYFACVAGLLGEESVLAAAAERGLIVPLSMLVLEDTVRDTRPSCGGEEAEESYEPQRLQRLR